MPIRSCTLPNGGSGYQWGSGKCFATRSEAVEQARAAYANGYAGDAILALDRSARRMDVDGRLHIELTNISKANVCPYYGREIPGAADLGLISDKVYYLYRDADELVKAAPTFNNIPLLDEHVIVSADDPKKDNVVGSTGTDAALEGEYLRNSLVVWDADAIARIESGEARQLSCAYRYVVVMTPGKHNGLDYDGRMTNIQANHVALVREGRAGPDVVVADGKLGTHRMLKSKKALMVRGAISAYLAPLALDAKPDIVAALDGVTAATFKTMKPVVAQRIIGQGKLNPDQAAGLNLALDAMEDEPVEGEDEMEEETEEEKKAREAAAKDKKAKDAKRARDAKKAKDEGDDEEAKKKAEELAEHEEKEIEAKDKKAMDAAIKIATDRTVAELTAKFEALAKAKEDVLPIVGIVHGLDSADAVYKFALDSKGVDTKDIHPSAYPALLKMLPKADATIPIALDSKARDSVSDYFPGLAPFAH